MGIVRPFWGVLLGIPLGGCFLLPSGESSKVEDVPENLKQTRVVAPPVSDRHLYGDVAKLAVGQWARYREDGTVLTLSVVGKEAEGVWMEVAEEGDPGPVSARLVMPEGVVKKAFYGEVSKGSKTVVVPQALRQGTAPASTVRETSRESGEESCSVAGRTLAARRIRVRFEDDEGRFVEEVTLWHPEVPPIYAGSDAGGLVRRKSGSRLVELLDFGTGARPLLEIPR
jgi:hypothetical protein